VTWINQDQDTPGPSERHFDIARETEIHFTGETTLDNGLTVGVHHEADIDDNGIGFGAGADAFLTEESYAYFSGAWGRVNFGKEDGSNYLLQVAAPSADEISTACVSTSTRSTLPSPRWAAWARSVPWALRAAAVTSSLANSTTPTMQLATPTKSPT